MGHVNGEAPLGLESGDEHRRLLGRDLPGRPAIDAMQVTVERIGQDVEFLAPVRAMAVAQDAEFLQDIQGPIDGRGDRGRIQLTAALDELSTRHVAV